ncbi:hypothetical protein BVI1335_990025 [Burkholderia vietnamiensis]|nr:hypothetical protein BVI1335_990025 [Burkholderia vietnamiensis]
MKSRIHGGSVIIHHIIIKTCPDIFYR